MTRKKICFALGNLYKWERKNPFDITRQLDIQGVEITLARKKDLFKFNPNKKDTRYLRSLEYVSIHAPFKLKKESRNKKEFKSQLKKIKKIYDKVEAKTVVMHPNQLPEPELIEKYGFNYCIENLTQKSGCGAGTLEEKMREHQKAGLCLDTCHALTWDRERTRALLEKYQNRLTQIHFSVFNGERNHLQLKEATPDFYYSMQPLLDVDVPFVIEEIFHTQDTGLVKEEIKKLRSFLERVV